MTLMVILHGDVSIQVYLMSLSNATSKNANNYICVGARCIALSDKLTSLLVIAVSLSRFIVLMALSYLADAGAIHFPEG